MAKIIIELNDESFKDKALLGVSCRVEAESTDIFNKDVAEYIAADLANYCATRINRAVKAAKNKAKARRLH